MLSLTTTGFNQKLFNFHSNFLIRPLVAMANPSTFVSSPPFSTSSSVNTTLKHLGTHNGSFHCDEALGCFMIRLTSKFSNAQIIRTRDPKVLEGLDAVLDVGGLYDPSNDRYDHHQKGFEEAFGHRFNTKLSSAGLVYKHFGKEIIAKELQVMKNTLMYIGYFWLFKETSWRQLMQLTRELTSMTQRSLQDM